MTTPVFVSSNGITPAGSGTACTTSALLTTTGSFLFVASTHYTSGVNVSAVVDTVGNTFVRAGTVQGGDANQDNEIWYTPDPIVGTTSNAVIVRYSGLASFRDVIQSQFSWGGATSITYDAEATHSFPSGSSMASNTLSVADEGLLIGSWVAFDAAATTSAGTGTIARATPTTLDTDMAMGFRLFTASAAAATISLIKNATGIRWSVIAKSFRAVAAGTSTPATALTITLPLTGAGQG